MTPTSSYVEHRESFDLWVYATVFKGSTAWAPLLESPGVRTMLGQLTQCPDEMRDDLCELLGLRHGSTYARAAQTILVRWQTSASDLTRLQRIPRG